MATELANLLNRGQGRMHALQGCPTFTWLGAVYDCSTTTLRRGTTLIVGGLEAEIAFTLIVPVCVLDDATSQPTAGKTVTFDSTTYRIARVGKGAGGSHYELDLISPNK